MRRLVPFLVVLMVLATPARAAEGVFDWDALPPMPKDQRDKFDRAAASMYDPACKCLRMLFKGESRTFSLPLSDGDRWLLFEGLKRGMLIPLNTSGRAS